MSYNTRFTLRALFGRDGVPLRLLNRYAPSHAHSRHILGAQNCCAISLLRSKKRRKPIRVKRHIFAQNHWLCRALHGAEITGFG
jgi:hypothetical protein